MWYLDCKHSAIGEINSTRICAFPIDKKHTEHFILKKPPDNPQVAAPEGTTWCDYWVCGCWSRLVVGLWQEVNYTVTQLMHSECGRICRGPLADAEPHFLGVELGGLSYQD